MVNTVLPSWLLGGWAAVVVAIGAVSVALGASLPTIALLLVLAVSPAIVMALINRGAPSPTVAEILYRIDTKGGPSGI
jgi:hypothetical protein